MTFSDSEEHQQSDLATQSQESVVGESSDVVSGSPSGSGPNSVSVATIDSADSSAVVHISAAPSVIPTVTGQSVTMTSTSSNNSTVAEQLASLNALEVTDSEKVVKKLNQIQSYIQQTSSAMQALEREGNMKKIGQYNTLVKTLRVLRESESQLKEHVKHACGSYDSSKNLVEAESNVEASKSEVIENEKDVDTSASAETSVEVTSEETVEVTPADENTLMDQPVSTTLQDRLAKHEAEQGLLSTRLRESVARREQLMVRYVATQERLKRLKEQRRQIAAEERRFLQSQGAQESPYEDPVPGAENWSMEEINSGINDFNGLLDKIDRVEQAYKEKLEVTDEDDDESRNRIIVKFDQLAMKRQQINGALSKLHTIKLNRENPDGLHPGVVAVRGERNLPVLEHPPSVPNLSAVPVSVAMCTMGALPPYSSSPPEETDYSNDAAHALTTIPLVDVEPVSSLSMSDMPARPGLPPADAAPAAITREVPPNIPDADVEVDSRSSILDAGANLVAQVSGDFEEKKAQLEELKKQVADMRKLLSVPLELPEEQQDLAGPSASTESLLCQKGSGSNLSFYGSLEQADSSNLCLQPLKEPIREAGAACMTADIQRSPQMLSFGDHSLSEEMKHDPIVIAKCKQLAEARERLNKMTKIMTMIEEARCTGQPLIDVIPAEYLHLLDDAKEEYNDHSDTGTSSTVVDSNSVIESRISQSADVHVPHETKRKYSNQQYAAADTSKASRDMEAKRIGEHNSVVSSSYYNKSTPSGVNEGSHCARDKGATKKQPQELWQEVDPRMSEVVAMQEELRQKKNALEALMKRMGKKPSYYLDNISDNLSEPNDRNEVSSASWGDAAVNQCRDSSEDEHEQAIMHHCSQSCFSGYPVQGSPRVKKHNQARFRHFHEPPNLSINNLGPSSSGNQGVRQKHNRAGSQAMSNTALNGRDMSWEKGANSVQSNNAISAALTQLNQVQQTVNNLYEVLSSELQSTSRSSNRPVANPGQVSNVQQMSNYIPLGQNASGPYGGFPLPNSSSMSASGGGAEYMNQMMSGLQQCFSQLYLHSLEIQALGKQLQVRPTFQFPPFFPPFQ